MSDRSEYARELPWAPLESLTGRSFPSKPILGTVSYAGFLSYEFNDADSAERTAQQIERIAAEIRGIEWREG